MANISRRKRKRAKRGRPRDEAAPRTASGRKSRARRPLEDPRAVALEARRRVLGLSRDIAGHEKAASVLGRLWLAGRIAEPLRAAGEAYVEIHADAMRALKAPTGLAVNGAVGTAGDAVSADYVAWAKRVVARYEKLKSGLAAAGALSIVESVAIEDRPPPAASMPALIEGLRLLAGRLGVG